jgi:hypothetical protein
VNWSVRPPHILAKGRSLKYEEVYLHAYDSVSHATTRIGRYLTFYKTAAVPTAN